MGKWGVRGGGVGGWEGCGEGYEGMRVRGYEIMRV